MEIGAHLAALRADGARLAEAARAAGMGLLPWVPRGARGPAASPGRCRPGPSLLDIPAGSVATRVPGTAARPRDPHPSRRRRGGCGMAVGVRQGPGRRRHRRAPERVPGTPPRTPCGGSATFAGRGAHRRTGEVVDHQDRAGSPRRHTGNPRPRLHGPRQLRRPVPPPVEPSPTRSREHPGRGRWARDGAVARARHHPVELRAGRSRSRTLAGPCSRCRTPRRPERGAPSLPGGQGKGSVGEAGFEPATRGL